MKPFVGVAHVASREGLRNQFKVTPLELLKEVRLFTTTWGLRASATMPLDRNIPVPQFRIFQFCGARSF